MNASHLTASSDHARAGMTLLEVLVACGILVMGLASVAAMLPAAGARLAEATAIDRAGTLSANCFANLRNRGVLKASLFTAHTIKVVVLGDMFANVTAFKAAPFSCRTSENLKVPASVFQLPDEWTLDAKNLPQQRQGGMSCIATLSPVDATKPVTAGSLARLTIVVFQKSSAEAQQNALTKVCSGVYRLSGSGAAPESTRKRFLTGCGSVLIVPSTGGPRWLNVGSSWTSSKNVNGLPVSDASQIGFTDAAAADTFAGTSTLPTWGFSQLIRVDERTVTLE
ncbi:MAG: hypothetical protein FJ284_08940 [Planctomycetes bacterium]|nr:hypothetical protein [Planctomycetota bacterium]